MTDAALKERLRLLRQGLQPEASTSTPSSANKLASSPPTSINTSSVSQRPASASADTNADQALFERLRSLKSTNESLTQKPLQGALPSLNKPPPSRQIEHRDEQDEIDALIQSTQDQQDLERSNSDNALASYDAASDHLSDSDLENDIEAITREADEIVNTARDEVAF